MSNHGPRIKPADFETRQGSAQKNLNALNPLVNLGPATRVAGRFRELHFPRKTFLAGFVQAREVRADHPDMKKKKTLRETIDAAALIDALEKHILGEREMTPSQVNAALALLKKTMPDMPAKEETAGGGHEEALKDLE